jgi:formate/nitrite transporter FocA (FNT family)
LLKKTLYQFIQHLAAGTFIGISVYGIIIYMGGKINEKVPAATSLLLGLGAVMCIIIIVVMGGVLDRIMEQEENGDNQ